ncbi:MAG: NAD-dependent epimerase/dehydratase family protein [Candidatus Woesearchaeota archaeon]|jgi:nucleoside-diphosphate-sugar epimerase|nr:NAD-dependent epimerase/dehydratase family protein [Candidatus Woesearchaeota archaeon]MDP7458281.1 NAD-dependent epimerase/dehydratase family protein [Candidatus Woesearchaeota archaeon]|tara:strand:+ start:142 stop:1050 length:909 start_codon:yes stop_codon:yes gene_type:complete
MIKGKKIMITGGAGFIGGVLKQRLEKDNEIIVFDKSEGHDILDYDQLNSMMKGVDMVLHLAAIAGQNIAWKLPRETMEVNLIGTYNVLNAMVENKVNHIVFTSTSEVYGPEIDNAKEDEFVRQGPPQQIRWMYATSKLACENFLYAYKLKYGMKITILRYFNVYGEGQDRTGHAGAIIIFIRKAMAGDPITVNNDGKQVHTWCHVDDCVDATIKAMESDKAEGEVFNIGNSSTRITIKELAERAISLSKSKSTIEFVKMEKPDIKLRVPNVEKAKKLLAYNPKVGLDEGIKRVIQWYQKESS